MKKLISILLVLSMLFISTGTVFASDSQEDSPAYSLEELFVDYHEYSLSEMVRFIGENPGVYGFIYYLRTHIGQRSYICPVHYAGEYNRTDVWDAFLPNFTSNFSKCFMVGSRPKKPDSFWESWYDLLGEKGDIMFGIEFDEEFILYINSLDYVEGNRLILNFLMNLFSIEDVVGFSWTAYGDILMRSTNSYIAAPLVSNSLDTYNIGDCNADGNINGVDGYLMRGTLSGNDDSCIDPLAVDISRDGELNAKDSLALKRKITIG